MCNCMLSIIVNIYSKSKRENNVFAFIPGFKSEVFPLTQIKYEVKCSECGRTYCYTRAGNVVQSIRAGHKCVCCCRNANLRLEEL